MGGMTWGYAQSNKDVISGESEARFVKIPPKSAPAGVAQPKPIEMLTIDWQKPLVNDSPVTTRQGSYTIQLLAVSSKPLEASHFTVYVNGKIRGDAKSDNIRLDTREEEGQKWNYKREISLKNGDNVVKVKVKNEAGEELSKEITIYRDPNKPYLHVLAIGADGSNLDYTGKDAKDFADIFRNQGSLDENRIFSENIEVETLTGAEASAAGIEKRLERLKNTLKYRNEKEKLVILYFSAHGDAFFDGFRLKASDYDPGIPESTTVPFAEVMAPIEKAPGKKLVFIDACKSGMIGTKSASPKDIWNEIRKYSDKKQGMTIIASCSGEQESYEDKKWENGAFTEALIEGLKGGKADADGNSIVNIPELMSYLKKEVPSMVRLTKGDDRKQQPRLVINDLGDVGIYVVEKN